MKKVFCKYCKYCIRCNYGAFCRTGAVKPRKDTYYQSAEDQPVDRNICGCAKKNKNWDCPDPREAGRAMGSFFAGLSE